MASLLPRVVPYQGFIATFIVMAVSAWVIGYAFAWLYNQLTKVF